MSSWEHGRRLRGFRWELEGVGKRLQGRKSDAIRVRLRPPVPVTIQPILTPYIVTCNEHDCKPQLPDLRRKDPAWRGLTKVRILEHHSSHTLETLTFKTSVSS